MKSFLKSLGVLMVFFFLGSCASTSVTTDWKYEAQAIRLDLKVDPQLNLYNGVPHTLYTVVYQLKDPNAFNRLIEDEEGLYKLLEGKVFDASVVASKTLIVNPGQDVTFTFDRAEGAKYVSIVAGYYTMQKGIMQRLIDIQVRKGFKTFFTKKAPPAKLNINLMMGPQQITDIEGKKQ